MNRIFNFLSAEFVFGFMPNGGNAVVLRTVFVSLLIYCIAIGLKSYTNPNAIFKFSLEQAKIEINSTIHWLGAIVTVVYASLYTRFASQWSYLASLYNQIMSVRCGLDQKDINQNTNLKYWEAGFLEDAFDLHLASKPVFSGFVQQLLEEVGEHNTFYDREDHKEKISIFEKLTKIKIKIPNVLEAVPEKA